MRKPSRQHLTVTLRAVSFNIGFEDVGEGYNPAINSYTLKPIDFTEFMKVIKLLGMYWLV